MDDAKLLKYIRNYFRVSIFTLLFFLTSFGPIFYKAYTNPNPPHTDNGLGMAYAIFSLPIGLTIILLLICINVLYVSKDKMTINKVGFVLTSILTIPVAIFGFLMLLATLFAIPKLLTYL
jgi:hypothetical protein